MGYVAHTHAQKGTIRMNTLPLSVDPTVLRKIAWGVFLIVATGVLSAMMARALRRLLAIDQVPLASSSIFINIARAAIWIIGASVMLDNCFGVKANAVIAALGVGGIAISLGCQDTFSNLIGGVQMSLLNLVKPGDNIEVGSESGVVIDITWRHTTIRDIQGQTVVIPNSVISKTAMVQLLPAGHVETVFYITDTGRWDSLDTLATELEQATAAAVEPLSTITVEPFVRFTEITRLGVKGKIVFEIEDALQTTAAQDLCVRAVAPIVNCFNEERAAGADEPVAR